MASATNPQRSSARALASRRLLVITGHGAAWRAELTDAGRHYLEHGDYPEGHFVTIVSRAAAPVKKAPRRKPSARDAVREPEFEVSSPAEVRRRGKTPDADRLVDGANDPWDEKVMITVKEAAWMLSLPETAIREAVTSGDVQRVFIGSGTTNYRVVYGSLLAWVDSMPREPRKQRWWR